MRDFVISMNPYLKAILAIVAIRIGILALGPAGDLPAVHAQSDYSYLYIEPGTTVLRDPDNGGQVQGKVVIDRRNGDVWGFPTGTSAPYPYLPLRKEPPWSKPIYLGRFDFAAMQMK